MSTTLQRDKVVLKNAINHDQSAKLIQTMLTMSFGCIAFLRGLFPDDSFIDQKFVPSKFEPGYDPKRSDYSDSIKVKTLLKGRNRSVDLFLDWVDKGCVDSIRNGYLKSLSLAIFLDKSDPTDIFEVYTFHFDYRNNRFSLGINDDIKDDISLLDSRKLLQQLMRRFIIITQSLNPLPEEKYISMRLLFNDNCPKGYQPPFFKDASNDPPATVRCSKSHLERYVAGTLTTGHHDIKMDIMSNSNALDQCSSDDDVFEFDPFVVPVVPRKKEDPLLKNTGLRQDNQSRSNTTDQSQTTAKLRSYLKSSPKPTNPTQELADIDCECGFSDELEDNTLYECSICHKKKHSSCYGFKSHRSPPPISCYSCRSSALDLPLHESLPLLMNARKFFNYLLYNKVPETISEFLYNLGFSEDDGSIRTAREALTYLIKNQVIYITKKPFYKKASFSYVQGSYPVDINISGLVIDYNGDSYVKTGMHGFQFIPLFKPSSESLQDLLSFRKGCAATKKLMFETTLSKCFTIDKELNSIRLDGGLKLESDDDTINSSNASSPASAKLTGGLVGLKLGDHKVASSQEFPSSNISTISSILRTKKRRFDDDQDNVKTETLTETVDPKDYLTSQPVQPLPRINKKRKTSVTANLINPKN